MKPKTPSVIFSEHYVEDRAANETKWAAATVNLYRFLIKFTVINVMKNESEQENWDGGPKKGSLILLIRERLSKT